MNEANRSALHSELGAPPPAFLEELGERELADLARVLGEARARQAEDVEKAIDHTMRFLPWGIRGAVKKVLIG